MRFRYLFGVLALGTLVIVSITPEPAQGCHWFGMGHGQGYGRGYGYGYAAPAPGYYAPAPAYSVAPGPSYSVPGPYYAPAPGVAPGPRPMPAPSTTANTVSAKDDSFDPATLNVQVGTTVRWVNNGSHPHTVTSNDGKWDSGELKPGASYTVTFMTAGTYKYHCKLHKGMEGTVVVGEPGKTPIGGGTGSKGY